MVDGGLNLLEEISVTVATVVDEDESSFYFAPHSFSRGTIRHMSENTIEVNESDQVRRILFDGDVSVDSYVVEDDTCLIRMGDKIVIINQNVEDIDLMHYSYLTALHATTTSHAQYVN